MTSALQALLRPVLKRLGLAWRSDLDRSRQLAHWWAQEAGRNGDKLRRAESELAALRGRR